ncbi:hypothetical protein DEM27_05695 [Metarhizobium album]|uniref:Uncharacterized protein n=1 Tax=Metarhizobium album TaxID=2182425 RepID=A0A2U2DUX9_9HYPH|nr:hypothetical protein [Rhizobium album]PWE57133.1 hypothetical protein DEM27_05695 [Rhizobium album]
MTIKSVINNACDILALDRFDTVYGNPKAQPLLRMAKEGGDEISRRVDWSSMLKTAAFAVSPAPIPNDYQRLIPGGGINTSAGEPIRPVTNGSQWAVLARVGTAQPYFFEGYTTFSFLPASVGVGAQLLYVSRNWIKSGTSEKDDFGGDDDQILFPERLLEKNIAWRWKRQQGLVYDDNLAEFEADLVQEIKADRGAQ